MQQNADSSCKSGTLPFCSHNCYNYKKNVQKIYSMSIFWEIQRILQAIVIELCRNVLFWWDVFPLECLSFWILLEFKIAKKIQRIRQWKIFSRNFTRRYRCFHHTLLYINNLVTFFYFYTLKIRVIFYALSKYFLVLRAR